MIEDVDLLARERTQMRNASTELLLNKLLNEMDGLREDADILFILTTNRPQELEGALASRPGRIDQAIEFPFPDAVGCEKLVRLYSHGLTLADGLAGEIVNRTENVSASFIKELMRRRPNLTSNARETASCLLRTWLARSMRCCLAGDRSTGSCSAQRTASIRPTRANLIRSREGS